MKYIPQQGDFVILSFSPQSGHEQQGRRPALVISDKRFNQKMGLAIVCPITNTNRNIPFHISVEDTKLTGFIMTEQVKSIDYNARQVQFVSSAKPEVVPQVVSIVQSVIKTL